MSTTTTIKATEAYLAALSAKERAEQAVEEAKSLLLASYAEAGITESECGELRVALSPRERRSFSVEKLRKAITPTLFRKVTKATVDPKMWDAAIADGAIPAKVIKSVVSVTEYVAVLVTPAKGAEKPVSKTSAA